jgi:hypothetical protein
MVTETRFILGLVAVLIVPHVAVADCVALRANLPARTAALVFSGTTTDVATNDTSEWPSAIVTFDVDRVWKGRVTKQFAVYSFTRTVEPFIFKVGEKYLIFAHVLTDTERRDLNLPSTRQKIFVVGQCGDGTREMTWVTPQEIVELGRANRPSD